MSSAVARKQGGDVASTSQQDGVMESQEYKASASANAGLNLNIFGAISGIFTSKSKKDTAADGSSVETRDENARVKGAGAGVLNAVASGNAEEEGRHTRQAIAQNQSKRISN